MSYLDSFSLVDISVCCMLIFITGLTQVLLGHCPLDPLFLPAATFGAVRSSRGRILQTLGRGGIVIIDESVVNFGSGGVNGTYGTLGRWGIVIIDESVDFGSGGVNGTHERLFWLF